MPGAPARRPKPQQHQQQQQQQPTVQQLLQPEEAASLIRAALHSRNEECLQVFCEQLQQLRHLSREAVRALLQEAVDVMEAGLVAGLQD
ncbi:hypothetical protein OEZ85_012773 [Tetradesmus obliquus]|uniref:Uncharacterized protein n=1 Tax=Tetradesmus obliquus TaxID=3088 RepID=A0ABY8U3L5_TETOB|nr:hypothetical protein OEZ85_012773 [Tetradesmus obliquus]